MQNQFLQNTVYEGIQCKVTKLQSLYIYEPLQKTIHIT